MQRQVEFTASKSGVTFGYWVNATFVSSTSLTTVRWSKIIQDQTRPQINCQQFLSSFSYYIQVFRGTKTRACKYLLKVLHRFPLCYLHHFVCFLCEYIHNSYFQSRYLSTTYWWHVDFWLYWFVPCSANHSYRSTSVQAASRGTCLCKLLKTSCLWVLQLPAGRAPILNMFPTSGSI